ncbi:20127_t:CDS:1, partial [Funneliformis geosporum]
NLKIPTLNIQIAYNNKSYPSLLSNIKDAIIVLRTKIRLTDKIENDQKIRAFIQKRIENFRDNPSAMINSCLE